jgi:CheY-like chemotaxis protein
MNKTVFVIDDDDDIRESLKEALEYEGYTVNTANNGASAIAMLKTMKLLPGLIILDMMMPIMDGPTFMELVNSEHQETLAKIPLILASAKGNVGNSKNVHFAKEQIKKPIELDDLYRVVKKYCGEA